MPTSCLGQTQEGHRIEPTCREDDSSRPAPFWGASWAPPRRFGRRARRGRRPGVQLWLFYAYASQSLVARLFHSRGIVLWDSAQILSCRYGAILIDWILNTLDPTLFW